MNTSIDKEISKRIKQLRTLKGFTQQELADELSISISGYSKLENGDRRLSVDNCIKLAKMYGVSCDYILQGEEPTEFPVMNVDIRINDLHDMVSSAAILSQEICKKYMKLAERIKGYD